MAIKRPLDDDSCTILICAVRYAIGRRTYISAVVPPYVARYLEYMDDKSLYVLHRDIAECNDYGDDCDKASWMNLLDAINGEMNRRAKNAGE